MYYVNDGVYGSFNCLMFDHATVHPEVLGVKDEENKKFSSSIWGPTCDSLDCISRGVMLPKVSTVEVHSFLLMFFYISADHFIKINQLIKSLTNKCSFSLP